MKVKIQSKNGTKIISINRRKTIREKCLNCSAWSYAEVTNCEFTDCDLYPFRTGRGKQDAKARSKSILRYCLWCMAGQRREIALCTCPDCPLYAYRQSRVDKSISIGPLPKNDHIEPYFEDKTKAEYL